MLNKGSVNYSIFFFELDFWSLKNTLIKVSCVSYSHKDTDSLDISAFLLFFSRWSLLFEYFYLPKFASRSQILWTCCHVHSLSLFTLGSSLFGSSEQAGEAWWCTKFTLLLLFSVCGLSVTYSSRLGGAMTSPARLLALRVVVCLLRTCLGVCLLDLCLRQWHLQQTSMQRRNSCFCFLWSMTLYFSIFPPVLLSWSNSCESLRES